MTLHKLEQDFLKDKKYIIGIDEAGRGPWAGPVTVSATLWNVDNIEDLQKLEKLNDSKKISLKNRDLLEISIKDIATAFSIADISHEIIDKVNILEATKLGIMQCLDEVSEFLEKNNITDIGILIDGKFNNIENKIRELAFYNSLNFAVETVIDGDALCPTIASASILAKVHRDNLMLDLHKKYPEYAFDKHKGYGTKLHQERLKIFGPSEIHRRSFRPIKELLLSHTF